MSEGSSFGLESLENSGVTRRPLWLDSSGRPTAAWLHHPRQGGARASGVLICPPFGFEYAHSHRTLLHLADELAKAGFVALRIDYPGTGDSAGDESTPDLPRAWLNAIENALSFLEHLTGGRPSLVGVRLGSLLAGVATERTAVEALVLWAPVVSGRRFVREVSALHKMSVIPGGAEDRNLEAGGFGLSERTAAALSKLDLARAQIQAESALLIDRNDQPVGPDLPRRLEALIIPTDTVAQSDYLDMMAEPQYTVVPRTTLDAVVMTLAGKVSDGRTPLNPSALKDLRTARSIVVVAEGRVVVSEELILIPIGDRTGIYGVLTRAQGATGPEARRLVILPNAGSVHHVGPNRLYVELARRLANEGVSSFRFDLRNLGDSRLGTCANENHPYPDTANDDVRASAEWLLTQGVAESCVLAGLCSGAHTAFHAAKDLEDLPISGVIPINPLTYRYESGMSLDTPSDYRTIVDAKYYGQAMRDPGRWIRLLKGESKVRAILGFLARHSREVVGNSLIRIARRLGIRATSELTQDLDRLDSLGRTVHFVFSEHDPGHTALVRDAGATVDQMASAGHLTVAVVPNGDHTFSKKAPRGIAIAAVVQAMASYDGLIIKELPAGPNLWKTLAPIWSHLVDTTEETSAFMSPDWVSSWHNTFGAELTTCGLVWSNPAGALVGCAMLSRRKAHIGPFPVSNVLLNASGPTGLPCEINDVLALPGYRPTVIRDLTRTLADQRADQVELAGVREELFNGITSQWPPTRWDAKSSESPYVQLDRLRASGVPYLNTLSGNTRAQIRRSKRRYEQRFGPVLIESASTPAQARQFFGHMLSLHDLRWSSKGRPSGLTAEAREFHGGLLDRLCCQPDVRKLRVELVRVAFGAETIGILYHLVFRGHVHFFQSGLRYHDDPHLKPGLVTHYLSIEQCLRRGDLRYDFLGGEPKPVRYKRSLTTDLEPVYWATLSNGTAWARALSGARRIKRSLAVRD